MSSSDGGSDDDVRRPRGRAARRMLGDLEATSNSHDGSSIPTQMAQLSESNSDIHQKLNQSPKQISSPASPISTPLSGRRVQSLFVSPSRSNEDSSDGEDLPANPYTSEQRFADLVARKRAEREAREAREAATEVQEYRSSDVTLESLDGAEAPDELGALDPEIERIMSDAAKPTRKASKKAMLDMERETQRLARQQALAHQMKVKKKFSTLDLLAKFKYDTNGEPQHLGGVGELEEEDRSASSAPNSDSSEPVTASDPPETPPSSPPTPLDRQKALVEQGALSKLVTVRQDSLASIVHDNDEELPDVADLVRSSGTATVELATVVSPSRGALGRQHKAAQIAEESDDDLDIIFSRPSRYRVFDNIKGTTGRNTHEPKAIHALKHLAHISTLR